MSSSATRGAPAPGAPLLPTPVIANIFLPSHLSMDCTEVNRRNVPMPSMTINIHVTLDLSVIEEMMPQRLGTNLSERAETTLRAIALVSVYSCFGPVRSPGYILS